MNAENLRKHRRKSRFVRHKGGWSPFKGIKTVRKKNLRIESAEIELTFSDFKYLTKVEKTL